MDIEEEELKTQNGSMEGKAAEPSTPTSFDIGERIWRQ